MGIFDCVLGSLFDGPSIIINPQYEQDKLMQQYSQYNRPYNLYEYENIKQTIIPDKKVVDYIDAEFEVVHDKQLEFKK